MTENNLYEHVARYVSLKYPDAIAHFDLSGVNNASKYTRSLYGRLNRRGFPDLFIAQPRYIGGQVFSGLFLELKKEGTRVKKLNGEYASEHIAEQAEMLKELQSKGYVAEFAVGLEYACALIDQYMQARVDENGETVF